MADKRVNVGIGYTVDKRGLEEMQSYFQRIANQAAEPGNKLNAGLQQAGQTAKTLDGILEKTFNTNLGTLNVTKFNQELQKSGLTMKQVKSDLTAMGNQGVIAYNKLAQAILSTNIQLKQSSKLLDNMFTTFKNTIRYGISSSIFNNFTNSVQKAYEYTRKLDTSLNNIRIVTGKSANEMDKFAEKANNAAQSLGASTLDMTQASLIYYQQGLSDAEAQARAETTVKVANVTGQKADEVSEQLTSVWNGYKVSAAETETYIDKLAAVAATTAADLEELSTGMSKVASAAAAMGVDFDDLTAQISTIVSVTRQAPESVGTALKTIYARIGDLKVDGVDEFGVKLGEVSSQLEVMGIHILDQEGNMRDMTSIMAEVADKWNYWTEAQKQAAAVAIAGKRQYNNLIALFENWDMYSEALDTAKNSLGTLQKQQDIYMESTQAKLTRLRATWQDLYKSIGDTKAINGFIDGVRNFVKVFDNFSDSFGGGLKSILGFGVMIANVFNKQITNSITAAIQRSQILKQNVELTKSLMATAEAGVAEAQTTGNKYQVAEAQAVAEATKEQYNYAMKIHELRGVLTQDQQNELLNQSKVIANNVQEIEFLKSRAAILAESNGLEDIYNYGLQNSVGYLQDINVSTAKRVAAEEKAVEIIKKTEDQIKNIITGTKTVDKALDALEKNANKLSTEEYKIAENVIRVLKTKKQTLNADEEIAKIIKQITIDTRKQVEVEEIDEDLIEDKEKAYQAILRLLTQIENKEGQTNGFRMQASSILETGENAAKTGLNISSLISSVSSLAMAWSSLNSLFDTWNDKEASFGDKMVQTMMTLGFLVPSVIKTFKDFYATRVAIAAAKKKEIVVDELLNKYQGKEVLSETLLNEAKDRGVNLSQEEAANLAKEALGHGAVTAGKNAEKVATDKLTLSQRLLNAARAADPIFWIVTALVAAAGAVALYTKYQEKQIEKQKEVNQTTIDSINARQEEIDSHKEAYEQYQLNLASKEDLAKAAENVAEKYGIELTALEKLTGQYEDFTEKVNAAREAELKEAIDNNKDKKRAAEDNMVLMAHKHGSIDKNNQFQLAIGFGASNTNDAKIQGYLERQGLLDKNHRNNTEWGSFGSFIGTKIDADNAEEILNMYKRLSAAKQEMDEGLSASERSDSQAYQNIVKILDDMKDSVTAYEESIEVIKNSNAELTLNQFDFASVSNMDEYYAVTKQADESLKNLITDEKEREKVLNAYLSTSSNAYLKDALALDQLAKKLYLTEDQLKEIKDADYLLTGNVNVNDLIGLDPKQISKIIELSKQESSSQDFNTVASLRDKVTSNSKLSKSDLKEKISEESVLAKDFATELTDFENGSQLDQLDALNSIVTQKIEAEQNYLTNVKEIAAERLKIEEQLQEELKNKLNEATDATYAQLKKEFQDIAQAKVDSFTNGSGWTDEQEAEYQAAEKALHDYVDDIKKQRENVAVKIEELSDLVANGLAPDKVNDSIFTMMIDGIDGVISEAKLLKDLTSEIGEGWVIATKDVEGFIKNFPELVQDQKNYNILADGSIKITEEGQKAYKEQLELRKQDLAAQVKAYTLEIQKQIDMKEATRDYYLQQAELLKQSLETGSDAAQIKADMEQNLANYIGKMQEITGNRNTDLTNQIIENSQLETNQIKDDVTKMAGYFEDFGRMIEASFATIETKKFEIPTMNHLSISSTSVGSAKQYDASKYSGTYDELLKMDDENKKKVIENTEATAKTLGHEIEDLASKKITAESMYTSFVDSLDNIGKSKDKNKKDKQKEFDDEFDRYYDIKKAIELVGNALEKVDKIQSKLHGKELIQSLKNENDLIKQQATNYEELYKQQQVELAEVQQSLEGVGAEFDENGFLTNYATLTSSVLEQYQDAIAKKNAGIISDEALQAYEKAYNDVKDQVERYNDLFYNEMKDTKDKLDDYYRQTMENNLKIWETEIQISLDTKQAERDWADFLKDINDDFRKVYKDLNIEMDHLMTKVETYSGMGTIETDLQAIHDVMVEIDKMNSGQASDMFESISDAQEKLKELDQQLEDDAKNMKQLWEDTWNTYLDGIDQASDKLDFMNDRFENLNEELEFQGKLIELLYGEKAYELMSKLYKGQEAAMQSNLASVKAQADMWHQLWVESGATLENQGDWNEDQQRYYDNWLAQQSKLNDLTTEYIELLQRDYINTVNEVLESLEHGLTGGGLLEQVNEQWQKITDYTDKYYDGIEHAYEVQKFANKIDEDIAKTAGIKNQQKLQALREKEITYLREKQNLTKYDLDAAEARYQIALKEIALEEAQENKTSMKLVRNEEGNWAYQYMADADEVAAKQDDLLTSYGDLYKLAGDAYQENLSELQELESAYLESARKIYEDQTMAEEERNAKLAELEEWYQETKNRLVEENELYRQDLQVSGAGLLLQVYQQDEEAYAYMTESEQAMLDALIGSSISSYQDLQDKCEENYHGIMDASATAMAEIRADWTASAQLIADAWAADDGVSVMSKITWAHEQISEATLTYQTLVDECAEQVGRDFGEEGIAGAIDTATEATVKLQDAVETMCTTSEKALTALQTMLGKVEQAWVTQKEQVSSAITEVREYMAILGQAKVLAAQDYSITGGLGNLGDYSSLGQGDGGDGKFKDEVYPDKPPYYLVGEDAYGHSIIFATQNRQGNTFNSPDAVDEFAKANFEDQARSGEVRSLRSLSAEAWDKFKTKEYPTWGRLVKFDTGGYTGDWGTDGRLAFLHQKELVLNAKDTENFLNGVSLLRDMVALNGSIEQSIAAAVGNMALQLGGVHAAKIAGGTSQSTPALAGDTYYVTADFPNANNAEEIKQAIMSLPNIVSQAIGKNKL